MRLCIVSQFFVELNHRWMRALLPLGDELSAEIFFSFLDYEEKKLEIFRSF
jgi:hypothetical protein